MQLTGSERDGPVGVSVLGGSETTEGTRLTCPESPRTRSCRHYNRYLRHLTSPCLPCRQNMIWSLRLANSAGTGMDAIRRTIATNSRRVR